MLQPQFNRYPKPTDFDSLYFLAQQAFESGFRGTTFKELANYLVEYFPERLAKFEIYDVTPSESPVAADNITRTYQPTESGTYVNFKDSNGVALNVDLTLGFVTITGNTTTGFKRILTPINLSGYQPQTLAELHTAWANEWFSASPGRNYLFDSDGYLTSGEIRWPDGQFGSIDNITIGTDGYLTIRLNRPSGEGKAIQFTYEYTAGIITRVYTQPQGY